MLEIICILAFTALLFLIGVAGILRICRKHDAEDRAAEDAKAGMTVALPGRYRTDADRENDAW